MRERYEDGENIYRTARVDDNFYKRNFFIHYKRFLDIEAIKKDKKGYVERLHELEKRVSKVNFDNNVLFVCDKDISRDIFLIGFSKLKTLKTYYWCNEMQLHQIMYGLMRSDTNPNIKDSESMFSEQDIIQDVLCLYVQDGMWEMRSDDEMTSLVLSRCDRSFLEGRKLLNWVFFVGSMYTAENKDNLMKSLFELYKVKESEGWQIVNLTGVGLAESNKTGKKKNKLSQSLQDIY